MLPKEIPERLKGAILERCQGSPFFIEEMVRAVLEGGSLPVGAPASVQGVIRSRLDRLDKGWRQVLEAAAVLGQVFRRRIVERMLGQPVEAALLALEERGLVTPERTLPEEEYAFKHVLTHEAVYESLVESRRAAYHCQAAEALEALYAASLAEHVEVLAYHYESCGNLTRAAACLLEASRKALQAFDSELAKIQRRHGLELLNAAPPSCERDRLEGELKSDLEGR